MINLMINNNNNNSNNKNTKKKENDIWKLSPSFIIFLIMIFYFPIVSIAKTGRGLGTTTKIDDNSANVHIYWNQLTNVWREAIRQKSEEIFKHWKNIIIGDKINISSKCKRIIEHIIQHPIDEEWSAKCIFCFD